MLTFLMHAQSTDRSSVILHYQAIKLSSYQAIKLSSYQAIKLSSYQAAQYCFQYCKAKA
ncbi:hypothetical protein [Vibrio gallaecicus]|uniref:hypothetical protein n=1 Tax=Vibrio gallaecicus TaxID=552386 RepID=UPI0025B3608A|nr:hypothetical protein [Vibrio gallaecicus]MDN3613220.1 hypothetical protein [Vibrio gallaecicus]